MKFWQVDAFTTERFQGNPAAVFLFEQEPDTQLMAQIAQEMNLSETAFVMLGDPMQIRWFTPNAEVNLCGHATLAAAHVLWEQGLTQQSELLFHSRSGPLKVTQAAAGYTLDFPLQPAQEVAAGLSLDGLRPEYVGSNGEDCMAVVDKQTLLTYSPDFEAISALKERGFLLTARDTSGEYDYLYRGFFPKLDVPEDPVTGSANTCLAPYWANVLGKRTLKARQVSQRGGNLELEVTNERVLITGQAVTVFEGVMA